MEKILVVNNDFDTMELLKSWLERKKYQVKFTGNGDEVPAIIKDFQPNLIIVDVLQGKVARQLKNEKETDHLPVLLMTGYTTTNHTIDIMADDIIEKPFNLEIFEKKIKKLVNGKN